MKIVFARENSLLTFVVLSFFLAQIRSSFSKFQQNFFLHYLPNELIELSNTEGFHCCFYSYSSSLHLPVLCPTPKAVRISLFLLVENVNVLLDDDKADRELGSNEDNGQRVKQTSNPLK
jgi:hypothetical protein